MTTFEPERRHIAAGLAASLVERGQAELTSEFAQPLLAQQVHSRNLQDDEIGSLLRNWAVGEVGTTAASVGSLAGFLGGPTGLQQRLRARPSLLPGTIEEILRLHESLANHRRVMACLVEIGGRQIVAGQRVCDPAGGAGIGAFAAAGAGSGLLCNL